MENFLSNKEYGKIFLFLANKEETIFQHRRSIGIDFWRIMYPTLYAFSKVTSKIVILVKVEIHDFNIVALLKLNECVFPRNITPTLYVENTNNQRNI